MKRPVRTERSARQTATRPPCKNQHQQRNADGQEACGQAGHTAVKEVSGCAGAAGILRRLRHNRMAMEQTGGGFDGQGRDSAGEVFRGISGLTGWKKVNSAKTGGAEVDTRKGYQKLKNPKNERDRESCGYDKQPGVWHLRGIPGLSNRNRPKWQAIEMAGA